MQGGFQKICSKLYYNCIMPVNRQICNAGQTVHKSQETVGKCRLPST